MNKVKYGKVKIKDTIGYNFTSSQDIILWTLESKTKWREMR